MITDNDVFRAERCGQTVHLLGRELWRASQESPKGPSLLLAVVMWRPREGGVFSRDPETPATETLHPGDKW